MKKTFLTIMLLLSTLMLVACGNVTTEIQTEAPTVAPTLAPVVTLPESSSPSSVTTSTSNCNHTTDYDKNGTVNSMDYLSCLKGQ